ncbi:MAG: hypothetical protein MUD01_01850 [Chloroflexaceae bacterium]|jgi:hypothetical protein|nr:hypothetical protein [Chloroflexaceae bacterium]
MFRSMFAKRLGWLGATLLIPVALSACSPAAFIQPEALAESSNQPQQVNNAPVPPAAPAAPQATAAPAAANPASLDLTRDAPFSGLEYKAAPEPIRADVPIVVNQPAPSDVNPLLLGPVKLLKSATINENEGTATLPLRQGRMANGDLVWYIITDTSDQGISDLMGVNYAPKLAYADVGRGVRRATLDGDGTTIFEKGKVDFAPKWNLVPGDAPNFFPPKSVQPGSVGDNDYTPLFRLTNGRTDVVYNAPVLAYGVSADALNAMCNGKPNLDIVHDKVTRICPRDGTVTIKLTLGYSFAKPVWYASFDSNVDVAATLERATLTPAYNDLANKLQDNSVGESEERLLITINGGTGVNNPDRQGLNSAISDGRDPINVFGGIPTVNLDYSPLWRLMLGKWSQEAIDKGYRTRIIDLFQVHQYETRGYYTSPDGGRVDFSGIVVNCPIFMRFN